MVELVVVGSEDVKEEDKEKDTGERECLEYFFVSVVSESGVNNFHLWVIKGPDCIRIKFDFHPYLEFRENTWSKGGAQIS